MTRKLLYNTLKQQSTLLINHYNTVCQILLCFSNFLNSYSKAFNKKYNRKGALFMNYLKRNIVRKDADFSNYIWYIHKNAVHHQLSQSIGEWPFDSYASMLSEAPTSLLRKEV